ncbi:hypothetical protein ACQKNB_18355 [Lysinibacillus xylanilyticus]|uniref:hypothetical protein n=1 Tax=Lysinibacillus xylanilyticus TaxID=582475 RepID=UPI003D00469A
MEQELCEQIMKLEKQLMHYRKADFKNILADNYREIGSSGAMYDKLIQLNSLENEGRFQNIPFVVRFCDPAMLHIVQIQLQATKNH